MTPLWVLCHSVLGGHCSYAHICVLSGLHIASVHTAGLLSLLRRMGDSVDSTWLRPVS